MTTNLDRDRDQQRLSFGQAAAAYDEIRPSYPQEAVAWSLDGHDRTVVDLGAGTGLLTRVIGQVAETVIPVEPDPGMRAQLEARTPGVIARAGSAEHIPADDSTIDAVLAGQAYHWFDHEKAHIEIARVLKPGGVFAPIWNIRDERVAWVQALSDAFEGRAMPGYDKQVEKATFGDLFGPVEARRFEHAVTITADGMVALMSSRSYFLTADDDTRHAMSATVRDLVAPLGDQFELPYVTYCFRAYKL